MTTDVRIPKMMWSMERATRSHHAAMSTVYLQGHECTPLARSTPK